MQYEPNVDEQCKNYLEMSTTEPFDIVQQEQDKEYLQPTDIVQTEQAENQEAIVQAEQGISNQNKHHICLLTDLSIQEDDGLKETEQLKEEFQEFDAVHSVEIEDQMPEPIAEEEEPAELSSEIVVADVGSSNIETAPEAAAESQRYSKQLRGEDNMAFASSISDEPETPDEQEFEMHGTDVGPSALCDQEFKIDKSAILKQSDFDTEPLEIPTSTGEFQKLYGEVDQSEHQLTQSSNNMQTYGEKTKDAMKSVGVGAAMAVGAVTVGPAALLVQGAHSAFSAVKDRLNNDLEEYSKEQHTHSQ